MYLKFVQKYSPPPLVIAVAPTGATIGAAMGATIGLAIAPMEAMGPIGAPMGPIIPGAAIGPNPHPRPPQPKPEGEADVKAKVAKIEIIYGNRKKNYFLIFSKLSLMVVLNKSNRHLPGSSYCLF